MVGWHHWLHRHEFEQALGVDDGQGSLACCSSWGCNKSGKTELKDWCDWIGSIWIIRDNLTNLTTSASVFLITSFYHVTNSQVWDVRGLCDFLGSVLPQQRSEMVGQCYSSTTAEFYLASKGKYTLEVWGWADLKAEASILLRFLLLYICLLPAWSQPYANWAGHEGGMFVHLKLSLQSMDFLLFHFCRLFPFFVF